MTDALEIGGLVGFDGPAPEPIDALPILRPDGRIPRALWVGGTLQRWERLMQGVPDGADRWDDVDCPSQAFYLLRYADCDISNGGLSQFYSNSTGDFADRFPEWARRIGAPIKADIIAETNLLFNGIDIRDRQARNDRVDELVELTDDYRTIRDPFDEPTRRYYASDEIPWALAVDYVERHQDDFFT